MFDSFPTFDPAHKTPMRNHPPPVDLERLWGDVFKAAELTEAHRYPYRVRAAHRITRALCIILGVIEAGDLLDRGITYDPYTEPLYVDAHRGKRARPRHDPLRKLFMRSDGLSLCPPPTPHPDQVTAKYDPISHRPHDRAFHDWHKVVLSLTSMLRIDEGSVEDKDQGWLGTCYFMDAEDMRRTWPSWDHIKQLDTYIAQETLEAYTEVGQARARKMLHSRYGYRNHEITSMVQAARSLAISRASFDVDFHKSLAIRRLEDLMDRARTSLNMNVELRTMKELHLVVGLGKVSPEDTFQMFTEAVTTLAMEGRQTPGLQHSLESMPPMLEAELVQQPLALEPGDRQIERIA